ncbi:MAG: hypothetical protein RIQ88_686 [Actinomycetota bacterium]
MKLRVIAIVTWVIAIIYCTFIAPSLESKNFKELVNNRSSLTATIEVIGSSQEVRGFNNSLQRSAPIKVFEPNWLNGKQGLLNFTEQNLKSGERLQAVISFRPSHRIGIDFKASLKHILNRYQAREPSLIDQLRQRFLANLSGVSSDAAALVAGLSIGDDSRLSDQAKAEFKVVSLTHLTAVSGANCAIVLSILAMVILRLPLPRSVRVGISLLGIAGYLLLVGNQPSVLRASAMVAIVLIGQFFGRKVSPLDAISLSVIGLLLLEPSLSLDYGFALSVLATLGLLVLAPKMAERFAKRMPAWLALLVAVTVAAQIACLPILLILQPQLPVYSVLANLLAEPLVVPITILGLISCLVSFVPVIGGAICFVASMPAFIILEIASHLANAPMSSINWFAGVFGIILAVMVTAAISGFFLSSSKKIKGTSASFLLVIACILATQTSTQALANRSFYSQQYTLVNCDVGQGDGLVIRSAGKVAVVDVGREDPAIDDCLSNLGISVIDLLVLTHYDMDHIGGLMGAITGRQVKLAMLTSFNDDRPGADFADIELAAREIPAIRAEKNMTGELGEFHWRILSPHRDAPEAIDSNDGSISMVWLDSQIALFTLADLGEKAQMRVGQEEGDFLQSGFAGRTVVVKVAHHGSADQAPEFYEAIRPKVALISVGQHNSYGHPTKRTLDLLNLTGTAIFRTDQEGAIGVAETESGLTVSVSGRS